MKRDNFVKSFLSQTGFPRYISIVNVSLDAGDVETLFLGPKSGALEDAVFNNVSFHRVEPGYIEKLAKVLIRAKIKNLSVSITQDAFRWVPKVCFPLSLVSPHV